MIQAGRWFLATILLGGLCAGAASAGGDKVLGKTSTEWLQILKEHKDARFRRASLLALETFGPKTRGLLDALYEALPNDPEPQIRREIAILLGRMGPDAKGGAEALGEALRQDKSEIVRQAAATALGGKWAEKAPEQIANLAFALKDANPGVKAAAAEALRNFGENARSAVPQLLELVKDKAADRYARLCAVQILSRYGAEEPETGPLLADILNDKKADLGVRMAAAEGLGRLDAVAGVPALGAALDDPDLKLRKAAAEALAQLGAKSKDAWPAMKKLLDDRKADSGVRNQLIRAAAAVAKENPEAVTVLADLAARDTSAENRLAAIQELGGLGAVAEPAVQRLQEIAANEVRAAIREAAEAAVKKIKAP